MNFALGFSAGFVAAAALATLWLLGRQRGSARSLSEVRAYLEEFLSGKGNPYDWDDFLSISVRDPYLDSIRNRTNRLQGDYPPVEPGHWCSLEGEHILRGFIEELKQHEVSAAQGCTPKGEQVVDGNPH